MMKFKGMEIVVKPVKPVTADVFKSTFELSRDGAQVQRILKKHGATYLNAVGQKLSALRSAMRSTQYSVEYRMTRNGVAFTRSDEFLSAKAVRDSIRTRRNQLIASMRKDKQNKGIYSPAGSNQLRAKFILNNYQGNKNPYLTVLGRHDVGYVHDRPGQILAVHEANMASVMFQEIRPMTKERHIGIEIECGIAVSRERLGILLKHLRGYVMIKGDGSVSVTDRTAVELNICVPVSKYKEVLKGVTDVLNSQEVKAKVNRTCGLHVHLDVREWKDNYTTLRDKYGKLVSIQGILYSMQPKSRQDNRYCVKVKSRTLTRGGSRYYGINGQAIWKYSTIETRLHAGTTDYSKISNWVELLIGVVYSDAPTPKRALTRPASMLKVFGLSHDLLEYVVGRVRQFSNPEIEEAEQSSVSA